MLLSSAVLLCAATVLNVRLSRTLLQVVKDQFNEEQLVVCRKVKNLVERQFAQLNKELLLAVKGIRDAGTGKAPDNLQTIVQPCFDRVVEMGVDGIEIGDQSRKQRYIYYPYRPQAVTGSYRSSEEKGRPAAPAEPSSGFITFISAPTIDGADMHLTLSALLDNPPWRISLRVNLYWFLPPLLRPIQSGKTGYAWIIDGQGRFLYHPHTPFVGRSAFEARREGNPETSLQAIETIQRDNMLKGLEGTGSYETSWHRGITGNIEKLVAYTPIVVSENPRQIWSVAVTAPVSEIENAVRRIHLWQILLQSLMVLIAASGVGIVLYQEIRWSALLEKTVQARTLALARSEENYRSLVESAEDFIFSIDREGKLLSVNSYTASCFGSSPEKVIGEGLERLFDPEAAQRQHKIVRTVFESGKSVRDEFELRVMDSEMWFSANFMPLRNEDGEMNAVLCIARDVTGSKKLERSLVNAEKLASIGTLAAGVAHEINTPLGVMMGFCDLLLRKKDPRSQEFQDLKTIERQGIQCKRIVENLLSFARRDRQATTDTDLNGCLSEIIKVVFHSLEMKGIELVTELAGKLPRVQGDDRQLQQVFLNLINNAAAAMPDGGRIFMRTAAVPGGKRVQAQVQDEGSGIRPDVIDHIFEPFFTTKPEGEGTGLGLFVSYGIITKFGGSITCESRTQEDAVKPRGTTFTVELPVHKQGGGPWRAEY